MACEIIRKQIKFINEISKTIIGEHYFIFVSIHTLTHINATF